ncbi:hypothetical protein LTR08_002990 [Meristemomyces frigidus]|nr:hypothetical protein LTR08_002990 [Meristemomyces frigidus]
MATSTNREQREPLLRRVPSVLAAPPILVQPGVEKLGSPVIMEHDPVFPAPTFIQARFDARKRRLPQCIAHRGYKAKFPENTLAAFKGAVEAGTHALETDVHITKDDVVVISHDATLERCFGREERILDCNWEDIKDARTLAEPHEPMPRLTDVLAYLAQPGLEDIWLLLDIKLINDAESIMRLIASTLASAPPSARKAWTDRVVLGIWAAKYLPLAQQHLPGYPVVHIGFSTSYARHFFSVPNVGFGTLLPTLVAPGGKRFIRDARAQDRRVLAWTVNPAERMEWCIRRGVDGVITDDPAMYLAVCEGYDEREGEAWMPLGWRGYVQCLRIWVWVSVLFLWRRRKFEPVASRGLIRRKEVAEGM